MEMAQASPEGYYLGVGRSTNIESAFLSVWFPGRSATLPFSFTEETRESALRVTKIKRFGYPLPAELKAEVYQYLDRMLPSEATLGSRPLVLHDYAHGGDSARDLYRVVRDYLTERGRATQLQLFVVGSESAVAKLSSDSEIKLVGKIVLDPVQGKYMGVAQSFADFEYDQFAEYDSYQPGIKNPLSLKPKKEFLSVMREVAYYLERDSSPQLSSFLQQHAIDLPENKILEEMVYEYFRLGKSFREILNKKMEVLSTRAGSRGEAVRDKATARFVALVLPHYLQQNPTIQDLMTLTKNLISLGVYADIEPQSYTLLARALSERSSTPKEFRDAFLARAQLLESHPLFGTETSARQDRFSETWVSEEISELRSNYRQRFGTDLLSDAIKELKGQPVGFVISSRQMQNVLRAIPDAGERVHYLGEILTAAKATRNKMVESSVSQEIAQEYANHPDLAQEHAKDAGWIGLIRSFAGPAQACRYYLGKLAAQSRKSK